MPRVKIPTSYSKKEVEARVLTAIGILFRRDAVLLENHCERSIAHKLASYLQELFPDYDVDAEYNRHSLDKDSIKHLKGQCTHEDLRECENCKRYRGNISGSIDANEKKKDLVYPDIIIHVRNQPSNLLVLEVKADGGGFVNSKDCLKLILFTSRNEDPGLNYQYRHGLFIGFNGIKEPSLTWYADGTRF
ncbi:MAG: hypothetical protein WC421_02695 [Elusimicrobiales bacterium]